MTDLGKQQTILVLGGATTVIPLVKRAKERGLRIVLAHLIEPSPCAPYADVQEKVNTLDIHACLDIARKHQIDAVTTVGTDQPLFTAAVIAEALGLPCFVDVPTAKAATNKRVMREHFFRSGIPVNRYRYIDKNSDVSTLKELKLPIVIKPLDSHGSRGVFKFASYEEVFTKIDDVLQSSFSREQECLVEEYYGDTELAVDGIVQDGKFFYLGIRKRNNLEYDQHIGFCTSVISPCPDYEEKTKEITNICQKIADSLGVRDGPLFVQILDGPDGFKINEAAARLAGGYGCLVNKALTGFDIIDAIIDGALGIRPTLSIRTFGYSQLFSSQIVLAKPGVVANLTPIERIASLPFIFAAEYYCKFGDILCGEGEAFTTVAYVCVKGDSIRGLEQNVSSFYDKLKISDENGANLVIRGSIYPIQI